MVLCFVVRNIIMQSYFQTKQESQFSSPEVYGQNLALHSHIKTEIGTNAHDHSHVLSMLHCLK